MSLTYSKKPQLIYGNGNYKSRLVTSRLPAGRQWRPMYSAPVGGTRPFIVATSTGGQAWVLHHRDAYRQVEVLTDWKDGRRHVQMTPVSVNPVAWASS